MVTQLSLQRSTPYGVIERYCLPRSFAEAVTLLEAFCDRVSILQLYQELFPVDFSASTASLLPENGHAYSQREIEFFALTEARCFPFPVDDFRRLAYRPDGFWIPFLGIDGENMHSLAQLAGGWRLIYVITLIDTYGFGGDDIDEWVDELEPFDAVIPLLRAGAEAGVYTSRFLAECRTRPVPWCYIPDAYDVCVGETGNPFYEDQDREREDDEESFPRFTREDFAYLTEAWQAAQTIEAHCDTLMAWLDESSDHAVEVASLWAQQTKNLL